MKIKFWGVRGSIPSPLTPDNYKKKLSQIIGKAADQDISSYELIEKFIRELPDNLNTTYGGNTSCVTISTDNISIILDAGSGLRSLSDKIMCGDFKNITGNEYHLFLSHLHWDHINGLPFFMPIHMDGTKINFYSGHKDCEKVLSEQQRSPLFPVTLESRPIDMSFHTLNETGQRMIKDLRIITKQLDHPNNSYSYRLTDGSGSSIVYATDGEYKPDTDRESFIEFYRNTDILIFDSQYSSGELKSKLGFGHSSNEIGIDIAGAAHVKKLVFFHHNHEYSDEIIEKNYRNSLDYHKEKYPESDIEIIIANENLEIEI